MATFELQPTPDPPASPRPTPLLLSGPVDAIDWEGQWIRIGSHIVEVPGSVSVPTLRSGDRVVVRGMRDPVSGRVVALEIVSARTPSRLADETKSAPVRILSLVVGLLAELSSDAQVLDCQVLPPTGHYAIRIEVSGISEKAVLIPRHILERALQDPVAQRTVRNLLHATIMVLRNRRAIGELQQREISRREAKEPRPWLGPRCIRCEGPLSMEDPILLESEAHGHLACPPML